MFIKCTFRKMTELRQGPTLGDTYLEILGVRFWEMLFKKNND